MSLEGFIERLDRVQTRDGLQNEIVALREDFEVEHLIYHSVNSAGDQYGALTYPQSWVDRYLDQNYARIDPVITSCFKRFDPVDWRRLDWSGKAQQAFLHEAVDAGVGNQGISIPIRGPAGQFATFTASHRGNDDAWEAFREARLKDMILIAHYVNQKALDLEQGLQPKTIVTLSPRETDALTLLSKGLNRAQAADRLTISEHTLRVYIESARFKLSAMNTTHAVAKALAQGLLPV